MSFMNGGRGQVGRAPWRGGGALAFTISIKIFSVGEITVFMKIRDRKLITEEEFRTHFADENLSDLEVIEMIASLEQFAKLTYKHIAVKGESTRNN